MNEVIEVLNTLIDVFIKHTELDIVMKAKYEAVKNQKFEEALELRDKELDLISKMPTIEQLQELKDKLKNKLKSQYKL